jgi:predicted membrane chloride channel (bestrophin family)
MPVLMLTYLHNEVFGFILNLLTVMCFTGLHEVARELESPFQNVPNDVPLNNFQAQYNEGIMVSLTSVQIIPL